MNRTTAALAANIDALADLLSEAAATAAEAAEAIAAGERNLAIGTLLQIQQVVPDAKALMEAAFVLHRGSGQR